MLLLLQVTQFTIVEQAVQVDPTRVYPELQVVQCVESVQALQPVKVVVHGKQLPVERKYPVEHNVHTVLLEQVEQPVNAAEHEAHVLPAFK